jgi:putative transposase
MKDRLERRYGMGHLHFITCSCYRRRPLLRTERARNLFLTILSEIRERYDFALLGYVVMPEHIHLLISEPRVGTPTTVMQVLKQRVSRAMHGQRRRKRAPSGQMRLWDEVPTRKSRPFWQRRFYDFNVWSSKKRNEKINYMHFNPVKRGLAEHPKDWQWSSYGFYSTGKANLCPPNPEWKPGAKA